MAAARREASRRRTRAGIAVLASRLSKTAMKGCPSDGENYDLMKLPPKGMYLFFKL